MGVALLSWSPKVTEKQVSSVWPCKLSGMMKAGRSMQHPETLCAERRLGRVTKKLLYKLKAKPGE